MIMAHFNIFKASWFITSKVNYLKFTIFECDNEEPENYG